MVENIKKVIRDCVDKDWLDKDPFWRYRVKHIDYKVPHLSAEELRALEEKEITIPRLSLVRDQFLFSYYTGFAYIDVVQLTTDHVKTGIDNKKWLIKNRQKTDISERVPVLPPVQKILDKYEYYTETSGRKLLPVPKELADICGLTSKLTFILPGILLLPQLHLKMACLLIRSVKCSVIEVLKRLRLMHGNGQED